jgi:hypothetical protein
MEKKRIAETWDESEEQDRDRFEVRIVVNPSREMRRE